MSLHFFLGGRVGTDPGFVGLEVLQFGGERLFMKLSVLGNTLIWLLLGHRKGLFGGVPTW